MPDWDSMTPRERDAWIAENAMGWHPVTHKPTKWSVEEQMWETPDGALWKVRDFRPTTDASADYLVLEKVGQDAGSPGDDFGWMFGSKLRELCEERAHHECGVLPANIGVMYRPGDYSHAYYLAHQELNRE